MCKCKPIVSARTETGLQTSSTSQIDSSKHALLVGADADSTKPLRSSERHFSSSEIGGDDAFDNSLTLRDLGFLCTGTGSLGLSGDVPRRLRDLLFSSISMELRGVTGSGTSIFTAFSNTPTQLRREREGGRKGERERERMRRDGRKDRGGSRSEKMVGGEKHHVSTRIWNHLWEIHSYSSKSSGFSTLKVSQRSFLDDW